MADKFIEIAKPFLIEELTKQIKENEKQFDVVESKIDTIITELKTRLEPFTLIINGIKLIPFGNPNKRLQELSDELKLKMDGIDFSELEKIPDIDPSLKDRIKALPDKVKTKLKDLVDELITGKAPSVPLPPPQPSDAPPPPSNAVASDATTPPPPPSKAEEAATTTAAATGFKKLDEDKKNETIDQIMKMLKDTGVLEEIKTRICTAAAPPPASPAGVGGAKKRRRKTKKNIRRNKNAKTRFGRTF
jgi:hypothetical protein